jgi:hypothetical protein
MKNQPSIPLLFALSIGACHATNVGLSTIEQPVNLGAESDPSRIPLGPVATESNYHYGRGPVITAARPSLHGVMEWKSGIEINQNLASVFGIELDNHDVPHSPANIRLRNIAAPAYSPYSREQVLAATIHCLLRSNTGKPKSPIQIRITAESPDDQALAAKYSKDYINAPDDENDPPIEYTKVPGTVLQTDPSGVTWVVFPEVKAAEAIVQKRPVFIPFRLGSDAGPDDVTWRLLPVWTGTGYSEEKSLGILGMPYPLFYDCHQPGNGSAPEANAMFAAEPRGSIVSFDVSFSDAIEAEMVSPITDTETLAATVLALVISSDATTERPLKMKIRSFGSPAPWWEDFKSSPGWVETDGGITCTLAWNPETAKLVQGSVPSVSITRTAKSGIYLEADPDLPEKKVEETPEPDVPEKPVGAEVP